MSPWAWFLLRVLLIAPFATLLLHYYGGGALLLGVGWCLMVILLDAVGEEVLR